MAPRGASERTSWPRTPNSWVVWPHYALNGPRVSLQKP